jgi:hypothetical protein
LIQALLGFRFYVRLISTYLVEYFSGDGKGILVAASEKLPYLPPEHRQKLVLEPWIAL